MEKDLNADKNVEKNENISFITVSNQMLTTSSALRFILLKMYSVGRCGRLANVECKKVEISLGRIVVF